MYSKRFLLSLTEKYLLKVRWIELLAGESYLTVQVTVFLVFSNRNMRAKAMQEKSVPLPTHRDLDFINLM